MKTLKELAQEALDVQNASNLSGVAQSFARAVIDLNKHCDSTTERNRHPIAVLWLDKMNSLAGIQSFNDNHVNNEISKAFEFCYNLVNKGDNNVDN